MTMTQHGLYLHVPFCEARCSYCSFATWTDRGEQVGAYFEALKREIATRCVGATFDTVYVGGGTPSWPEPAFLAAALARVREVAIISPNAEITLEVNPESVDERRAEAWVEAGFNRVSVGVQSFNADVLAAAARLHGPEGPARAVELLRAAGFRNLSLDLIAGLPGETSAILADSRRRALELEPDHISLYLLELDEAGKMSPLAAAVRAGRVRTASDDELADRYEESCADIEAAGLTLYEISNFATPGRQSRHNLKYWLCEPVLACGVSAHWMTTDARRRFDVSEFERWLSLVAERGEAEADASRDGAPADLAGETLMLGLRLVRGVDLGALEMHHPGSRARFDGALAIHVENGLVARDRDHLALTPRGRLLSNEVFRDLL